MLLAGGQGSRLHVLTKDTAKPALPFGGKYRIIDFPLSNCSNSGIDTVGVLTQYRPLELNSYIGNGQPWDLDSSTGGIQILPPYMGSNGGTWYKGTANAVYQNIDFIDQYDPDYVVILSGDHIYKMDYSKMVAYHRDAGAACTISVMEVPWCEASRYGVLSVDNEDIITEFAEKPERPKSNLASMGIYVFSWRILRRYLINDESDRNSKNDFGRDLIPKMLEGGERMAAYRYEGYWKDVGTLVSLWDANMDVLSPESGLDLLDESWPIYARTLSMPTAYLGENAKITHSAFNRGGDIEGTVENSVLSPGVKIAESAHVSYSVLMPGVQVESGAVVKYSILGENCRIGTACHVGGAPEDSDPENWGLTVLASGCELAGGCRILPKTMLDRLGREAEI